MSQTDNSLQANRNKFLQKFGGLTSDAYQNFSNRDTKEKMLIRVLPLLILFLLCFVGFKTYSSAQQSSALLKNLSTIEPASGGEAKKEKKEKAKEKPKEKKGKEEKSGSEGGHGEAAKSELPDYVSTERPKEQIPQFTQSGKALLEQLAARRQKLDNFEKELDLRANMVEASAKKLDDKIARLEKLQATTEKLLAEYRQEDANKLGSMVKIYESMKPKDAAEIFNQMDMPIMLDIADKMGPKKLAGILAKMDKKKARDLTEKLVQNRELANLAQAETNAP